MEIISSFGNLTLGEEEIPETTHYELDNVKCFENSDSVTGKFVLSNLYVPSYSLSHKIRKVKLVCETETKIWNYQEIIMHSISTSTSNDFPPCIYCHLDSDEISELRFVPPDVSHLTPMFEALSEGAALNPDDRDSEDSEEDLGNFYYNKNEFPDLDLTGGSLPEVFFKLGEGGQIEVYDDGEPDEDEQEGEEWAGVANNTNDNAEDTFADAEEENGAEKK